ncbi:TPA: DNA recombination protein RmuC [Candidatus Nomurabacteria bacterium]|nr:DNA recombination protein RmuC [Candidatus Nomurabacteria bacterium]
MTRGFVIFLETKNWKLFRLTFLLLISCILLLHCPLVTAYCLLYTTRMSSSLLFIILAIIIIALLVILILRKPELKEDDNSFLILQDQLERLRGTVENKLERSASDLHQVLHRQNTEATKLITEITRELTEVKEGNKQVFSMTEQLQNLEKVLTHQKQRGNLGEASLELILSNMLAPGQYEMQYAFKDGKKIVDAVIHTKEGIIPVDAKYSLDNYQRLMNATDEEDTAYYQNEFKKDIQKRIDETAEYIKPEEGTLPFAFMFIPAEGIYYDLLVNQVSRGAVNTQNLIEYAYNKRKVIIVSPTTFYAYLQSVLYGFKAFKIEESAKHIQKRVEDLGKHLEAYEEYMKKLGATLGTSVNHYNTAYKELKKVDKDVLRITGEGIGIEPAVLDKPSFEED